MNRLGPFSPSRTTSAIGHSHLPPPALRHPGGTSAASVNQTSDRCLPRERQNGLRSTSIWTYACPARAASDGRPCQRLVCDGLQWPHRDGLKWPHFRGVVVLWYGAEGTAASPAPAGFYDGRGLTAPWSQAGGCPKTPERSLLPTDAWGRRSRPSRHAQKSTSGRESPPGPPAVRQSLALGMLGACRWEVGFPVG